MKLRFRFQSKLILTMTLFITIIQLFLVDTVFSAQAPNIIFILADDLGWDDVGFHGSEIQTPNIDRLAKEGVVLNNYYVNPICTPTRSAILTGRYPIHTGLQHSVIESSEPYGLPLNVTTLPQHLKEFGYKTHAIGKWHLGFCSEAYIPENRGFDSFLGYYNGREDYFDHHIHYNHFAGLDFHYQKQPLWNYSEIYSTDIFANHAKSIIETHDKSSPLFIYLAHQGVHAADDDNIQAPQKYIDRFHYITDMRRKIFAGAVAGIDDSVGIIYNSLVDAEMADNTIIVFTTDNGGPTNGRENNAACNWPLRGSKATLWQGGVHVLAFVHSPLLQTKSYVNDNLFHATDWMPTFLSLAANRIPKTNDILSESIDDIDGFNQWDVLSLNKSTHRKEVLVNIDPVSHNEAIIVGDFKLIHGESQHGRYDGWYPPPPHKTPPSESSQERRCNGLSCQSDRPVGQSVRPGGENLSVDDNVLKTSDEKDEGRHQDLKEIIGWMNRKYEELKQSSLLEYEKQGPQPLIFVSENDRFSQKSSQDTSSAFDFDGIVKVDCGPKPLNASTNCNLNVEDCLFNIKEDPCEYMNLVRLMPDVAHTLRERINFYRKSMVPPLKKPIDPRGNPALHGGVWVPWL